MTDADAERVSLLVATAFLFLLVWLSVRHARASEARVPTDERFYPVPIPKFLILSISTFGVYHFYWQWRCWRRFRAVEQVAIRPIWRAIFAVFWVKPLFDQANRQAAPPIARWIGMVGVVGFVIVSLTNNLSGYANNWHPALLLLNVAEPLFLLPTLIAVNRANPPTAWRHNRRIRPIAVAWIILGVALYAVAWLTE